ncbi:hypothetical protein DIPPA_17706 [Diplonema papillatum]|nr:hypothetical protein DIPPA_17706 [Diplonema papillatum]
MDAIVQFFTSERFAVVASEGLNYVAAVLVMYIASVAVTKLLWPKLADPYSMADNILSIPLYGYLAYLAVTDSMVCVHTLEDRWFTYTPIAKEFFFIYVSRSLVHIPYMFLCDIPLPLVLVMSVHHLISTVCFFGGLYTEQMSCWGLLDGCCEISTFFLSIVFVIKDFGLDTHPAFRIPSVLSGFCLWLSYLVFRLFLFPYWLYQFYTDVTEHPEKTWEAIHPFQRYIYPATTILLLVLSIKWMWAITMKFARMVQGKKVSQKRQKKEE